MKEVDKSSDDHALERTIEELDLFVRLYNYRKQKGILTQFTIWQKKTEPEMMKVRNLGRKSLTS